MADNSVFKNEEADSLGNVSELDELPNSDDEKDMVFSVKDQELLIEFHEVEDGASAPTENESRETDELQEEEANVQGASRVVTTVDDGPSITYSISATSCDDQSASNFIDGQSIQLPDGTVAVIKNLSQCKFPNGLQVVNLEDGTVAWLATGMLTTDDGMPADQLGLDSIDVQIDDGMLDEENKASVLAELASAGISIDCSAAAADGTASDLMSHDGNLLLHRVLGSQSTGSVQMVEKTFQCSFEGCERLYTTLHHLKVHQRSHTGVRPFPCEFAGCGKAFSTGYALKSHRRIHTGEKPYVCVADGCDKAFKTSGDLQKHTRTHTGEKPFRCPYPDCDRSFTTSNIRKVHIRTHTHERPYSCDEPGCGKTFASATNYKNHIRIHSGEKPYVCTSEGCGKRFTEYSSLYKHHVVHTHKKPYECADCGKTYRQTSTLAMHRRMAHCDTATLLDPTTGAMSTFIISNSPFDGSTTVDTKQMISLRLVEDSGLRSSDEADGNLIIDTSDTGHQLQSAVAAGGDDAGLIIDEHSTIYGSLSSNSGLTLQQDSESSGKIYVISPSQLNVLQRIVQQPDQQLQN